MKKLFFLLALCASVGFIACQNESSKAPAKTEHKEGDGHDHAKDSTHQHKEGDGHKH